MRIVHLVHNLHIQGRTIWITRHGESMDNVTGLMWEKKDDSNLGGAAGIHDKDNLYSWSTGTNNMDGTIATIFLAGLNASGGFAGYTDWRVPNLNELETLRNLEALNPSTFSAFNTGCAASCTVATCSCTPSFGTHWSSSTSQNFPTNAWSVYFNGGSTNTASKTETRGARAVRAAS